MLLFSRVLYLTVVSVASEKYYESITILVSTTFSLFLLGIQNLLLNYPLENNDNPSLEIFRRGVQKNSTSRVAINAKMDYDERFLSLYSHSIE